MKKVKKVFFAWQLEKEQAWLEELARSGYVLKATKPFTYFFEKCDPIDLVYQFDFQIFGKKDEEEYLGFFKEWTLASKLGGWYYFYKQRSNDESDTIFNDNESRNGLFRRLIVFLAIVGFPLYYQIVIMYPNMDSAKFEFPNFYFFLRIVTLVFAGLHMLACLKVLGSIVAYRNRISE